MTRLILSTGNIMGGGTSVIRRGTVQKSNAELVKTLRAHFHSAQHAHAASSPASSAATSNSNFTTHAESNDSDSNSLTSHHGVSRVLPLERWTSRSEDLTCLHIPEPQLSRSPLREEREAYDITLKLFYLPGMSDLKTRETQTRQAVELVLQQLGVNSVDLLIASFPGISFDADDEDESDPEEETRQNTEATSQAPALARDDCGDKSIAPDPILDTLGAWRTLEDLNREQLIRCIGIAEFGSQRLSRFLRDVRVRPKVDQINVRDCSVVPKQLILYAQQENIELLTHSDCTNILPADTLKELLEPLGLFGAEDQKQVRPLWVVKYTAVLKDQGVVENKGYFAVADLEDTAP